ncbi:YggT family protein [Novosphingobium kunmingense]|uniref:YggT family protein n=1 Tax=Novosphingobium kunmingense TaxID=1211806 RepID=A0A2N0H7A1_9SPHN|nr:YggT family protein [Novosphingobium kunmingense]
MSILSALSYLIFIVRMVLICQFILYLLIAFNVIDLRNRFIAGLWEALNAVLEPMLGPIRRRMPAVGGMDFSYMVLLFGLWILQTIIGTIAASVVV